MYFSLTLKKKNFFSFQTISFRRKVLPADTITDFPLNKCYYLLFPIGGGRVLARKSQDFQNPKTPIGYHDLYQPRVSRTKICICDQVNENNSIWPFFMEFWIYSLSHCRIMDFVI